ncbi:MAG: SPOR domain-containing protein [Bacteroidales bacterium]|jgi:nucleoid DNA-binding protein/cell division septation protein DedD|nr:SPOR domain-containing protein [Bacteroidales bacterium]
MNLGQYISKLLPENEMVIIPDLGALVSKYKHAGINSKTGEITPPSKEIIFYRQIINDDGLLVDYIAEINLLPRYNALKIIKKECENIIYRLDKGERVLLEGVGEFFMNENNEIMFESHFNENMFPDSFGLEPVNFFEKDEYKSMPAITDTGKSNQNEELNKDSDTHPENEPVITPITETKRKTVKLWYLLLVIPLVIATFFMLSKNNEKVKMQVNHKNPEIHENIADTIYNVDSTQASATDSVEITEHEINKTEFVLTDLIDSTEFYLVVGSFKEEENVGKYIEQFDIDGYEPFYIGKTGSFHIVGIGKYNTEQEAYRARRDYIKKKCDPEAWIYKKQ